MPTKISDALGVSSDDLRKQGVFDGFIDVDSKFYVDPRLLEKTKTDELEGAYSKFQSYFSNIFDEIYKLIENKQSEQKIIAYLTEKLKFQENSLVGLGYSANHTEGKGIGTELGARLAHNALKFTIADLADPAIFEITGLFEKNFGADRISDMTICILQLELLKFSERVARILKIKTKSIWIENQYFN